MPDKCPHCAAGDKPVKMKRRYVHHIDYRNYPCTEVGFQYVPGAWADIHSPREWVPRRIRRFQKRDE